ncbi:hypothetical protein LOK49_LG13G00223 [Camellia lanceoleosa]|uniref:Uncharacterized protein n=1 Tax=Camellia lanceoleosa TaxID=1840588 RepID=A0ACC0FK72_9ERIC|nr:hypothetical protein LOK49_LG13G00223 [Camellia lanceoleosa]
MGSRSLESYSLIRTPWPRKALLIFGIGEEGDGKELGDFVRGELDYDDSRDGKRKKFEKDGIGSSKKREKKSKSKSEGRDGAWGIPLADPPSTNQGLSSPNSSLSSMSAFSPKDQCDLWSPRFKKDSSFDIRLDNPFHVQGLKEFIGPYSTMVEVPCICRDSQKLDDIKDMLQNFWKMKYEKLAFWINIHNALVMHLSKQAFLAYGIAQNNIKVLLVSPATYNVRGHVVSADTIQNSILGCRMSHPRQTSLFPIFPKKKKKILLNFEVISYNQSCIPIYTPKRVFQELEVAKEEYIRSTFGVRKDQKILLPKTVESFAKDSGLCLAGLLEMIQQCMPESVRKSIKKC